MVPGGDIEVWAPGRVNLIGDHTDYTGGFAMPMAIHLGTTISGRAGGRVVELTSEQLGTTVHVPIDIDDPSSVEPAWGRYVAGIVAEVRPQAGFVGTVRTTLPLGSGLSSSAALEVSTALALGADLPPTELAALCQRAEQRSSGVPCGIMDQLAVVSGRDGAALLLDCESLAVTEIAIEPDARFVVIDSGQPRGLAGSEYAERRARCEQAAEIIGPLRSATAATVEQLDDPVLRRRARHVVSENDRVHQFAAALRRGDRPAAGALMAASHQSLRDDFEVSTPILDELVGRLLATPGVHGARLTGAGFGGCVVALTEPGVDLGGWPVRPAAGARRLR